MAVADDAVSNAGPPTRRPPTSPPPATADDDTVPTAVIGGEVAIMAETDDVALSAVLLPISDALQDNQSVSDSKTTNDATLETTHSHSHDACGEYCLLPRLATRFGWWGVSTDGSKQKIGEYQDLDASPFWDVDALLSDGCTTWDFTISGLDNEANDARLYYFDAGSGISAKLRYERFLRMWDHDLLQGTPFPPGTPYPPGDPGIPGDVGNVRVQDLNVGEDYAIRVQEFDAKFQGRISDNLKWRLNLWGMRKFGERQVNAVAHCFNTNVPAAAGANGNTCHVLSQRQTIDWTTVEVQPVLEARIGHATLEYSRTMRSFGQDDLVTQRTYTRFDFNAPAASGFEGPPYTYAFVPENFTQIDRLKISAPLADCTNFFANLYYGDTENEFRNTHREFSGVDLRVTNRSFDNVTLVGYVTLDDENNDNPPFFFKEPPLSPAPTAPGVPGYDEASSRHPIDRTRFRAGVRSNWRPFDDECYSDSLCDLSGLSVVSGYEFYRLDRDYATFPITLSRDPGPPAVTVEGTFTQPDTIRHQIEFGPAMQWSPSVDSYVRYKGRFIEDPLLGVREHDGAFNTNQPEQEHGVDIGGTWAPASNFLATAQFSMINRWHQSQFADFTEDDYPIVCTVWYAPCDRWSFTGGYAYFSNWIDQDITLGFWVPGAPVLPGPPPTPPTETTRWDYEGQNHLVSIGTVYAWSKCVRMLGGYEWNHGTNVFSVPASPALADWSALPAIGDVEVITQRLTAGVDWQPYQRVNVYFRYIYFDWDDIAADVDSGTAHMFLAGMTAVW
jgi:hypothetical protein